MTNCSQNQYINNARRQSKVKTIKYSCLLYNVWSYKHFNDYYLLWLKLPWSYNALLYSDWGFPDGSYSKESSSYAGDRVRSLGHTDPLRRYDYPLQYSCPGEIHGEEPGDYSSWVTKSWTYLSNWHFDFDIHS